MDSIAAILQAMMQQPAPRVTPMGAAPSGGGGGVSVPAKTSGGFSSRRQAPRQGVDVPDMLDISAPASDPTAQEGLDFQIPYRRGQEDPYVEGEYRQEFDRELQPTGDQDISPLYRQAQEARMELSRWNNPSRLSLRESQPKVREQGIKAAQEAVLQADSNIMAYEQAQRKILYDREQARIGGAVDNVYQLALQAYGNPDIAMKYAIAAKQDPTNMGKIVEDLTGSLESQRGELADVTETMRGERRELDEENRESIDLAQFYLNETPMGTSDSGRKFASGLARNNVQPEVGFQMWTEHQEAIATQNTDKAKSVQSKIARAQTYSFVRQKIGDMRRISDDALVDPTGMTGSIARGILGVFGDEESGINIGKSTAYGEMKTLAEEITSNTVVDELGRLKELSPTGGTGFGQFTEKELRLVRMIKGDIDPDRPPEEFWKAVGDYEKMISRLEFLNFYGEDFINESRANNPSEDPMFLLENELDKRFPLRGTYNVEESEVKELTPRQKRIAELKKLTRG